MRRAWWVMRRASVAGVPVPPDPPEAQDWGTGYPFPPKLGERELYRTVLVTAGDEVIDLQAEVAIPSSPVASTFTIGGADAAKLEAQPVSSRFQIFTPATRAALAGTTLNVTVTATNTYGTSNTVALVIKVPANADCRFASYASGSDANNGTTPALAWKYAPGTASYTGSAVTLGAGKALFFKGAESHRYIIAKSGLSCLDHAGSSGNPMIYAGSGWGGRAVIDGSDVITGWSSVTQAEVSGNPNWANIEKVDLTSQGGALALYQHLFCGDVMCYPAQGPTPVDLRDFEGPGDPAEDKGMWRIPFTTSGAEARRMYQTGGSGNAVTIVDPWLATTFGAHSPYTDAAVALLWGPGNETTTQAVLSYDQGASTITVACSGAPQNVSGYGSYGISHHPVLIVQAGQFALSPDRTTLYAWRPNADATSVSRRNRGMSVGLRDYVVVEGFTWQRISGDSTSNGVAFAHTFLGGTDGYSPGVIIRDHYIRQNRANGGDGVGYYGTGGGGLYDFMIERLRYEENPRSSGIRTGNRLIGVAGGSAASVRAYPLSKIRWCYAPRFGLGRTGKLLQVADGIHVYGNVFRDLTSVHGNVFSLYDPSSGDASYSRYIVLELNYGDNCERCYTTSLNDTDKAVDRFNTVVDNIFLGAGESSTMNMPSGEPGSYIGRNLIMNGPDLVGTANAINLDIGNRVTVSGNVVSGISDLPAERVDAAYTITDNLLMVNSIPPGNGGTQIVSGNTVATGAPIRIWDGIITSEMAARLGAGPIGVFHNV